MKIKVVGYMDTDALDPSLVDTDHVTGLSEEGRRRCHDEALGLTEKSFRLVRGGNRRPVTATTKEAKT